MVEIPNLKYKEIVMYREFNVNHYNKKLSKKVFSFISMKSRTFPDISYEDHFLEFSIIIS